MDVEIIVLLNRHLSAPVYTCLLVRYACFHPALMIAQRGCDGAAAAAAA